MKEMTIFILLKDYLPISIYIIHLLFIKTNTMRNKSKHYVVVLLGLFISVISISCGKNSGTQDLPSPIIIALSPENGVSETEVTIKGRNFGSNPAVLSVTFGSNAAVITSQSDTLLIVKAPASDVNTMVQVGVMVNEKASNTKPFTYKIIAPVSLTSVSPTCFYKSTVIIKGNNISPNINENIVRFGTKEGTVIAATETSLYVTTPDLGDATSTDITVTTHGKLSNAMPITVDTEQNKIATYNWATHTTKPGVVYKSGTLSLFGDTIRRLHVLDIDLNDANTLGIGFSTTNATTVEMCENYNGIAGINAGYFPMSGASDKDPYIRINGETMQAGHMNISYLFTNAALIIHNNVAKIQKFSESGRNLNQIAASIPTDQAQNIIVCGPMLVTDNVIENLDMTSAHNKAITARTGLGISRDGKHVYMVVADYGDVTGITTLQLAKILQALGAVNAMNFDGGGSSTMFVQDQGTDGRVSVNGYGQRKVRSVIYVK